MVWVGLKMVTAKFKQSYDEHNYMQDQQSNGKKVWLSLGEDRIIHDSKYYQCYRDKKCTQYIGCIPGCILRLC